MLAGGPGVGVSSKTQKLHSLNQFLNHIRLFGPTRFAWCFIYESQNAPFNKIMRRNSNYHNVPWSLAKLHEKLEGVYLGMNDDVKMIFDSNGNCLVLVKHCRWGSLLLKSTSFSSFGKKYSVF
jgi:hypothetical protein